MKPTRERGAQRMFSLRWILSAAVVGLTTAIVVTVGALVERNARETLTRELLERAVLEARNLALTSADAILSDYPELTLAPILSRMLDRPGHLTSATVVDLDGVIRGHADPRLIGEAFVPSPSLFPLAFGGFLEPGQQVLADETTLLAAGVIHGPGGAPVGHAYVTMDRLQIERAIDQIRTDQMVPFLALLAVAILTSILIVSVLLRPIGALREGLDRIGRGDLDTPVNLHDRTELGLLARTINDMSSRLRVAQQEHIERERLSREVELAREIQSSLLPSEGVPLQGCEIVGAHRPAAEVGGDFYDIFPLSDGRAGMVIADVSGKGLAGCLVASMTVALIRAFRETESSPSQLLMRLNDAVVPSLRRGTFVTVFYGILEPSTGRFTFASAGHSPMLVYRAATERTEWYEPETIPIGAVRGDVFRETIRDQRITVAPDDVLVQYTDGVNEAFDMTGEKQFGFERLAETVRLSATGGCARVIDAIRQRVADWAGDQPSFDDETLVAIQLRPLASAPHASRASSASRISPHALLKRARERGRSLQLRADLTDLAGIRNWLVDLLPSSISQENLTRLQTALYEVAANIVEHGYGDKGEGTFELWWLPDSRGSAVEDGFFLFRDDAAPFSPDFTPNVDFDRTSVRRQVRGFGMALVRAAMRDVAYCPGTSEGNVTVMVFDPQKIHKESMIHG